MKYLKKIFENWDEKDDPVYKDLLDCLVYINDKFGQPTIYPTKYGNSNVWNVRWDIKMDFNEFNDADAMITKLRDIVEDIDDVLTTADKLEDYTIDMAIVGTELKLRVTPKETGDDNYKFIVGQDWREIKINITEITRFFNKNGIKVIKVDDTDWNEISEQSSITIYLDKIDTEIYNQFSQIFNDEKTQMEEDGDLDRSFEMSIGQKNINIYPTEEKTYIVI
jgi:hypothetical protein